MKKNIKKKNFFLHFYSITFCGSNSRTFKVIDRKFIALNKYKK